MRKSSPSIREIKAIDVHAHYGPYWKEESPLLSRLMSSGIDTVTARARTANTEITFVSPTAGLLPAGNSDAVSWNEKANKDTFGKPDCRFWVIVDPKKAETYEQTKRMLKLDHCIGIKIHPEQHGYPISKYGNDIFSFALKHKAIVLSHSGQEKSMPEDIAGFANDFPGVTIVAAHMGYSWDRNPAHHAAAVQLSKHGNLYVDTSSMMSIMSGLLEWTVKEIGSDRLLYGTDSPLYFAPAQRARIDYAEISDLDKKKILRENALRLFEPKLLEGK